MVVDITARKQAEEHLQGLLTPLETLVAELVRLWKLCVWKYRSPARPGKVHVQAGPSEMGVVLTVQGTDLGISENEIPT